MRTVKSDVANKGSEATAAITGTMRSISESAGRIAAITAVIDGIALLDAAVEAARAGERGRGFTVVASVRTGIALPFRRLTGHPTSLANSVYKGLVRRMALPDITHIDLSGVTSA